MSQVSTENTGGGAAAEKRFPLIRLTNKGNYFINFFTFQFSDNCDSSYNKDSISVEVKFASVDELVVSEKYACNQHEQQKQWMKRNISFENERAYSSLEVNK